LELQVLTSVELAINKNRNKKALRMDELGFVFVSALNYHSLEVRQLIFSIGWHTPWS
jgi:hypothetical protein